MTKFKVQISSGWITGVNLFLPVPHIGGVPVATTSISDLIVLTLNFNDIFLISPLFLFVLLGLLLWAMEISMPGVKLVL